MKFPADQPLSLYGCLFCHQADMFASSYLTPSPDGFISNKLEKTVKPKHWRMCQEQNQQENDWKVFKAIDWKLEKLKHMQEADKQKKKAEDDMLAMEWLMKWQRHRQIRHDILDSSWREQWLGLKHFEAEVKKFKESQAPFKQRFQELKEDVDRKVLAVNWQYQNLPSARKTDDNLQRHQALTAAEEDGKKAALSIEKRVQDRLFTRSILNEIFNAKRVMVAKVGDQAISAPPQKKMKVAKVEDQTIPAPPKKKMKVAKVDEQALLESKAPPNAPGYVLAIPVLQVPDADADDYPAPDCLCDEYKFGELVMQLKEQLKLSCSWKSHYEESHSWKSHYEASQCSEQLEEPL